MKRAQTLTPQRLAEFPRHFRVGQFQPPPAIEHHRANVERIGAAMFADLGAHNAVAAAAFITSRNYRCRSAPRPAAASAASRSLPHPVRDRRRHGAAQHCRRRDGNPPPVRQHDRIELHHIRRFAAVGLDDRRQLLRVRKSRGERHETRRGLRGGLGLRRLPHLLRAARRRTGAPLAPGLAQPWACGIGGAAHSPPPEVAASAATFPAPLHRARLRLRQRNRNNNCV